MFRWFLVTTLSDPHDVIRGLECRADNFILKPYTPNSCCTVSSSCWSTAGCDAANTRAWVWKSCFGGQRHFITADRLQILNLLLSTYEAAMQRNHELSTTRDTLRQTTCSSSS